MKTQGDGRRGAVLAEGRLTFKDAALLRSNHPNRYRDGTPKLKNQ
jgi:hypothetical protein